MERRNVSAAKKNERCELGLALIMAGLYLLLLASASCERRSVETVTTASQQHLPAADEKPLISTAQLPPRPPVLEAAGDRVAEARIDLKRKNTAAALRAIASAEEEVRKASANKPDGDVDHRLAAIISRLQIAEQEVERHDLKAAASELRKLNQELNR
jgi:hypothetical protein